MHASAPRWIHVLGARWRALFGRTASETQLNEELLFHFETVVEESMARGLTRSEAERAARLQYGGVAQIKESCRDARGISWIENVRADVLYALRGFRKAALFTSLAIGTVALGVGVNTAMFSILYSLVFRPLPVPNAASLYNVYVATRGNGSRNHYGTPYFISAEEFSFMRAHSRTAEIAALAETTLSWKGAANGHLEAELVSENLLPLLGAQPLLGRFFTQDETGNPGGSPVAVLSYDMWRRYFGASNDVIGRTLRLNQAPFTVIGVAGPGMHGPVITRCDIWIPYTMQEIAYPGNSMIREANTAWLQIFARPRHDASSDRMRAELPVLAQQAIAAHGSKLIAMVVVPGAALFNSPEVTEHGTPVAIILFLAVSLVLLTACANVANMLLARSAVRRREIAIRLSIGAGRWRLLQQLLTESVLLSLAGGVAGLALAGLGVRSVLALLPESVTGPIQFNSAPDISILLYTLGMSLMTGILFGIVPALNSVRLDLTPALKSQGLEGVGDSPRGSWLQNTLIAGQVAISLVLLLNAGLLVRGLRQLVGQDTGRAVDHVIVTNLDLRAQQYTPERAQRFTSALIERVRGMVGVHSVAVGRMDPPNSQWDDPGQVIDKSGHASGSFELGRDAVTGDYFETMGIKLVAGRTFTPAEVASGAAVAVVDTRFVKQHLEGGSALGRMILLSGEAVKRCEIIGVVAEAKTLSPVDREYPLAYTTADPQNLDPIFFAHYDGDRAALMREIARAASSIDPNVTASNKPIEDNIQLALAPAKIAGAVATTLACLALLLAVSGIYGLISFAVARRTREIGIRVALGARRGEVLRLVAVQVLKPIIVGAAIGAPLAIVGAQLIRAMLYGLSVADPVVLEGTILVLGAAAVLATIVPARTALAVDPAITLRHE